MEIRAAKYLISSPKVEDCPPADKPEYAFIGRSNVGKSSLINMITYQTKLAKTSGSPGKTQMINHFLINYDWYMVDLPGYGFAKVSQKQRGAWERMIEDYLRKRENLVCVFVLIDSRLKPQKLDLDFINQLGEWGIPFCLVFTKADKNTQRETAANVRGFIEKMKEEWEFIPQKFVTSTIKFHGRKDILNYIGEMNEKWLRGSDEDE